MLELRRVLSSSAAHKSVSIGRGVALAVFGLLAVAIAPAILSAQQLQLHIQASDQTALDTPAWLTNSTPSPVQGATGDPIINIGGYRWLVQRDLTPHTVPSTTKSLLNPNTISLQFFKSYQPLIAKGTDHDPLPAWVPGCDALTGQHAPCLDPTKNYYISVLPNTPPAVNAAKGASCAATGTDPANWCGWYSQGGSPIYGAANAPLGLQPQTSVTVRLVKQAVKTGTLSVHTYQDNFPINGEADLPDEPSMPGLTVTLDDGVSLALGGVVQDAFGNLLGTQYKQCPSTGLINGVDCSQTPFAKLHKITATPAAADGSTPGTFDPQGVLIFDSTGLPVAASDPQYPNRPFVKPMVTGDCGYTGAQGTLLNPPAPYGIATAGNNFWGAGPINTLDACGELVVEYLRQGKYGVQAIPDSRTSWIQTSTIEGTHPQEAFVVAGGTEYFQEFGPPGYHAEIGFTQPFNNISSLYQGTNTATTTVTGRIVNLHLSAPPEEGFFKSAPVSSTTAWIGLNPATGATASGTAVYVGSANKDGTFSIPGVPAGAYTLFVFDNQLDFINQSQNFTVNLAAAGPPPEGTAGALVCNAPGSCDFGDIAMQDWFHRSVHVTWYDDGSCGQSACAFQAGKQFTPVDGGFGSEGSLNVNLRYRDGSIYQSSFTDPTGTNWFDEVFPFFNWIVADFDAGRLKLTGVTSVADIGGGTDAACTTPGVSANCYSAGGAINPQTQPDGKPYRFQPSTADRDASSQAFQGFNGNTNAFFWGLAPYGANENGGIRGMLVNDIERAEDDPRYNFSEPMQVGVPSVPLNLYKAVLDGRGNPVYCNTPGSATTCPAGPYAQLGPKVASILSDSWDNSQPTGCKYLEVQPYTFAGNYVPDCFDGMRVWNMVRPGVFDGGYQFKQCIGSNGVCSPTTLDATGFAAAAGKIPLPRGQYVVEVVMPTDTAGKPLYQIGREEDKNADFGEIWTPHAPLAACVGDQHTVPSFLNWFGPNGDGTVNASDYTGVNSRSAGLNKPLCDRKLVTLTNGAAQSHIDFFMFSEVPPAAHITGFILDDFANEFNKPTPTFGEKYSPPFLPVSLRDWTGVEIARSYSDAFGTYDLLVPAGAGANPPTPASYYATVYQICMNSRLKTDGTQDQNWNPQYGEFCYFWDFYPARTSYLDTPVVPVAAFTGPDQFPVDCNFPTGTPRIQQISSSGNGVGGGPYIDTTKSQAFEIDAIVTASTGTYPPATANNDWVPNPNFCPGPGVFLDTASCNDSTGVAHYDNNKLIQRDYGFGLGTTPGKVDLRIPATDSTDEVTACTLTYSASDTTAGIVNWSPAAINLNLPSRCAPGVYQVVVTRGDNNVASLTAATLTVGALGNYTPANGTATQAYQRNILTVGNPANPGSNYSTVQAAIDTANPGDLILVAPGTYREILLMWKPVQIQGWGEGSTNIDAVKSPSNKLSIYRKELEGLWTSNINPVNGIVALVDGSVNPYNGATIHGCPQAPCVDLLNGQAPPETGITETSSVIEPSTLYDEQGGDFLVLGKSSGGTQFQSGADSNGLSINPRIDGFSLTGADAGGGVVVNAYGHYLGISNNHIHNNQGFWNGGIRLGLADLLNANNAGVEVYTKAPNDHIVIRNNQITTNATLAEGGAGATAAGAVLFCTGADNYRFTTNYVCGNFSDGGGGAVGHFGVSNNGRIDHNSVIFNETFFQGATTAGGGIALLGTVSAGGAIPDGVGNVTIDSNLIQGNSAGAGDGGGIYINGANGLDLIQNVGNGPAGTTCSATTGTLTDPSCWYAVNIFNNMIVDNVSALAGGGISMIDSAHVVIVNNTIANNFSLATAGTAFQGNNPNQSQPSPAGIASRANVAIASLNNRKVNGAPNTYPANLGLSRYSNPILFNNILYGNQAWYFFGNPALTPVTYKLVPFNSPNHPNGMWDTGVIGVPGTTVLSPNSTVLSAEPPATGFGNITASAAPNCGVTGGVLTSLLFVNEYCNGSRQPDLQAAETIPSALLPTIAFDEGGNNIRVRYGPLSLRTSGHDSTLLETPSLSTSWGNYHLNAAANNQAAGAGTQLIQCLTAASCYPGTQVYTPWQITIPGLVPNTPAYILGSDIDGKPRPGAPGAPIVGGATPAVGVGAAQP